MCHHAGFTEPQREWLRSPTVQKLPTKLVFTIKPGKNPDLNDPSTWIKRKVRLAEAPSSETYSATAPAEVVRIALVLASKYGWASGILDIVAAFLRTPLDGLGVLKGQRGLRFRIYRLQGFGFRVLRSHRVELPPLRGSYRNRRFQSVGVKFW